LYAVDHRLLEDIFDTIVGAEFMQVLLFVKQIFQHVAGSW